jgi:hypothetical protein
MADGAHEGSQSQSTLKETPNQQNYLDTLANGARVLLAGTFVSSAPIPESGEGRLAYMQEKKTGGRRIIQDALFQSLEVDPDVVAQQAKKTDFAGILGLDDRAAILLDQLAYRIPHPTQPLTSEDQSNYAAQVKASIIAQLNNPGDISVMMQLFDPIQTILTNYADVAGLPKDRDTTKLIETTTHALTNDSVDQNIEVLRAGWEKARIKT